MYPIPCKGEKYMSRKRITMRKIKEILRLKLECNLSNRKIAASCKVGRSTVQDYINRARVANLSIEQINAMTDEELDQKLFPLRDPSNSEFPAPDYHLISTEMKRQGVTLQLLWEEYLERHPDGYSYSQFCHLYRQFMKTADLTMRQTHKASDKVFLDYNGKTVEVFDQETGKVRKAEIFVAVMGASNYTYAEATWTQSLEDWIGSNVRALSFFGGVPAVLVPDNLKSGVSKAYFYDPDINPTYAEMARHYKVAVLPAKSKKPRYKAKVEGGVLLVQRWILACLRNHRFFSLSELNTAIRSLLVKLNNRPFKKLKGTRQILFDSLDKPELRALPEYPYEFATWKKTIVGLDYHVEFKKHYYSVPHHLIRQKVEIRATTNVVEIYHQGNRIASHVRSVAQGKQTTVQEHMPQQHQFCKLTPEELIEWAEKCGPHVAQVIKHLLSDNTSYLEQAFRSCLGILNQSSKVGNERLDAACKRAIHFNSMRCKTIVNILLNNQDRLLLPEETEEKLIPKHRNIRGSEFYKTVNLRSNNAIPSNDRVAL
jgi:transposase